MLSFIVKHLLGPLKVAAFLSLHLQRSLILCLVRSFLAAKDLDLEQFCMTVLLFGFLEK